MAMTDSLAAQEALRDFYWRSQRVLDRVSAAHGASTARMRLMTQIASEGSVRFVDLVEAFGFAPRTITDAVDALESDGLVERKPDPVDRRAKRISLTAAGESILTTVKPVQRKFCDRLFEVLTDKEREQFTALLGRLNRRLQELEESIEKDSVSGNESK
jgi:DNA-binding MarR family transcriptional regulator